MLYQLHEMNRTLLSPLIQWAEASSKLFTSPVSPLAHSPFSQRIAAGYELIFRLGKQYEKPEFIKEQVGKRDNDELVYELALIFPNNRWATNTWVKDSLGRNIEAKIEDNKYRIKEIIPYWVEEQIYDFQSKKRIRYHEMIAQILPIIEIAQIFTLNNKVFVQIENDVKLFGNKNLKDTERLFEIIKSDLLERKRANFLFVKDITTIQRKNLYSLLESKGFKRRELFRHYSY
jgi:hypothetical protein